MDNLALRLSYGLQGNIDKNTSPYLIGDYKNETILNNEETSISISGAPNDKLRWEKLLHTTLVSIFYTKISYKHECGLLLPQRNRSYWY